MEEPLPFSCLFIIFFMQRCIKIRISLASCAISAHRSNAPASARFDICRLRVKLPGCECSHELLTTIDRLTRDGARPTSWCLLMQKHTPNPLIPPDTA